MSSCLLLNSDALPLSYLPLSTVPWEEAIKLMVLNKVSILEFYENWTVHSPSWSTEVPAVMMLRDYEKRKTNIRFSKSAVFLRDLWRCQYCGTEVNRKTATLDHVLPISHGGKSVWENCSTACSACNSSKGNNPRVVPKTKPYRPNYYGLVEKRKQLSWELAHPSWAKYLA